MEIHELVTLLQQAKSVVVMTGAGVSAESGIPTFRDALDGHWSKFNAEDLATPEAFARDPELVTRWYDGRREQVLKCQPNPGHFALAAMQQHASEQCARLSMLTQNVDGLHARAGSTGVTEVHGSITTWRCTRTGDTFDALPSPLPEYPAPSPAGGLLRPNVVWFGESLPELALRRAAQALHSCDLYLAIGTSGLVFPAAGFVHEATEAGAKAVEINLQETPMSQYFDGLILGRSGQILPQIAEAWFGYKAG